MQNIFVLKEKKNCLFQKKVHRQRSEQHKDLHIISSNTNTFCKEKKDIDKKINHLVKSGVLKVSYIDTSK